MSRIEPLPALWRLVKTAPRKQTFALLALMSAVGLTEGFGIMMLVPLLESLAGGGGSRGAFSYSALLGVGAHSLGWLLCLMVALTALRAMFQHSQAVSAARLQHRLVDELRMRCFSNLVAAEWQWLAGRRSTDHAALLVNNIGRIGVGLNQALTLIASIISLLACLGAALLLSWKMAMLAGGLGLVLLMAFGKHRRRALALGHDLSHANRQLLGNVQEGMAGIRLAKIWQGEGRLLAQFSAVLEALRGKQIDFVTGTSVSRSVVQVAGAMLVAVIVYAAVRWWQVSYAVLLPLVLVFGRMTPILSAIQQSYHHWLHAVPVLGETQALLDETEQVAETVSTANATPISLNRKMEFANVSFGYSGRALPVLADASFIIPAGSITAIAGQSGAGKSTLGDLIAGLLKSSSGSITVDGTTLEGPARRAWRRSVAYVEQDTFLLNDSIKANLLWAYPDASEQQLTDALNAAAADFVLSLSDGIETMVGDGGTRLSGGERQRLGLARALLGKPSLLILDEATSALDGGNERAIRDAIGNLRGRLTIVLIGHRQWITHIADQVIELDETRINIRAAVHPSPKRLELV